VPASPERVQEWIGRVKGLQAGGSTNLFAGLEMGYRRLDDDRTSGLILVTDGVSNVGPTERAAFLELLRRHDLRLFTFVIGNSADQPLLETLARETGGFAMNLSERDDIGGRLLQARAKVLHECLHGVQLSFKGKKVRELTPARPGNLYLGQQLVMFGRFDGTGPVEMELKAQVSGQERTWKATVVLPEVDRRNPELERLWALSRIEELLEEGRQNGEKAEARAQVVALGKEYSLVTDHTSMVVVHPEVFAAEGIDRQNAQRVERERQAGQVRAAAPVSNYRVDQGDNGGTFGGRSAPGLGTGPVGPLFIGVLLWLQRRRAK
jgi:Ca-activated chloride channel homolog